MTEPAQTLSRRRSPAVAALAATAFCYGTTENLPIGLLGLIGDSLHASAARTGLLVTAYGLVVAAVSVPLTRLTARYPRRPLLLSLLAVFAVATLVSAVATTYSMLLAARVVTAFSHAVFWSVAPVAAAALFPPEARGRASSLFFAGGSLSVVVGVPVGTWLGQQTSWRWSFAALSAAAAIALYALAVLLPPTPPEAAHDRAPDPDRRIYLRLVATTAVSLTGFYTFFTYVTVYLTETAGFALSSVSAILLAYGLCDILGLTLAATLVDRRTRPVLYLSLAALMASQGLLALPDQPKPLVLAALSVSAAALPGLVCGLQVLVLRHAPGDLSVATAGTSAAFNAGAALGALLGGALLAVTGPGRLPLPAAALTAAALVCLGGRRR